MIPYGHQSIDDDDIQAVLDVLRSDYLTQGPKVEEFEKKLAEYCGAKYAVVVSNGTTALHAAYFAIGLKDGDEFITSAMTFPATSNAGIWQGGKPVFVDIDPMTGNINVDLIEEKINKKTKAIVPIDYTGRPVDLDKIKELAEKYNLVVIEDACQSLGASYKGKKIGSISDLTVFSFHPVKSITTGEGGAIITNNEAFYKRMKLFITHGITKVNLDKSFGAWYFNMVELGQNYRLTEFQCALGENQLKKLDSYVNKRIELAKIYNNNFKDLEEISIPLDNDGKYSSAWHLYVIRLNKKLSAKRSEIFDELRAQGIGVQVHHIPLYMHSYYKGLGYIGDNLPNTQNWYNSIISLPLYPGLTTEDQEYVIKTVRRIVKSYD